MDLVESQESLNKWQGRLDAHYRSLRQGRGLDQPIFGLEHGLSNAEVDDLSTAIRAQIVQRTPNWEHRLAWIVYATELGYQYAGDEYWQSFESSAPGWEIHGDRYWIQRCFLDFHVEYGGAKPSGPWAHHFTIICWPISHAILPTDLQRHLARILYDLRHVILSEELDSPIRLGRLIASRSLGTPSRFEQLTQEPLFIGQIAAALLLHSEQIASSLILPSTLERIGNDLEKERRSRTWLRSARESTQQRIQFQRQIGSSIDKADTRRITSLQKEIGFQPRLILRPRHDNTWDVLLEMPDLSPVLTRLPALRDLLYSSPCRVVGSSGRSKARGWLLYGPQRIRIREWPGDDEPLIEFDKSLPPWFENLLRAECLLYPGPSWLFKIASDGLAYEIQRAAIRADHKYLLLYKEGSIEKTPPTLAEVEIRCEGVRAVLIDVPSVMSQQLCETLDDLGINQAGTIHLWPAGLAPSRWDGEGSVEWLSIDIPCVGVRADYPVSSFSFKLDSAEFTAVPGYPGVPIFIEIQGLYVGSHTLHVSVNPQDEGTAAETTSVNIIIRDPQIWVPGGNSQGAILAVIEPRTPSLEQFWEGEVYIEIHGPSSRKAKCEIAFFRRGRREPISRERMPALTFPISNDEWHAHFDRSIKESKEIQKAYDLADTCTLRITAEELGSFCLAVEREFTPLRWARYSKHDKYYLRLLDDTSVEIVPEVFYYEYWHPDISSKLNTIEFLARDGYEVLGGLYLAKAATYQRAVIIPPVIYTIEDLENLRTEIHLLDYRRTPHDVESIMRLLSIWRDAHQTGNIFSIYIKRRVVKTLIQQIFRLIAGERWPSLEESLIQCSDSAALQVYETAYRKKMAEVGLAAKIIEEVDQLSTYDPIKRATRLAHLFKVHIGSYYRNLDLLSEFTLRLASGSRELVKLTGDHVSQAISELLETPSLARVARLMVLLLARKQEQTEHGNVLYSGWDWR